MKYDYTIIPSTKMKGGAMRGRRQLEFTCLGIVIKRLMAQLKLNLQQVADGSSVPYTTLYDWTNGVIPNNPDQLKKLKEFFSERLPQKISVDYLLYGTDKDQEELKKIIEEQQKRIQELEHHNAEQGASISFMQWIIDENKKKDKEVKSDNDK